MTGDSTEIANDPSLWFWQVVLLRRCGRVVSTRIIREGVENLRLRIAGRRLWPAPQYPDRESDTPAIRSEEAVSCHILWDLAYLADEIGPTIIDEVLATPVRDLVDRPFIHHWQSHSDFGFHEDDAYISSLFVRSLCALSRNLPACHTRVLIRSFLGDDGSRSLHAARIDPFCLYSERFEMKKELEAMLRKGGLEQLPMIFQGSNQNRQDEMRPKNVLEWSLPLLGPFLQYKRVVNLPDSRAPLVISWLSSVEKFLISER